MISGQQHTFFSTRGKNVYYAILDAIRHGVYKSGDRLLEKEVADRLGVSRTPVREAFSRLQDKGLLEPAPGRGLAVAQISMQQIFELYTLRVELEKLVARSAAQYATPLEIDHLERVNEEFGAATDPARAFELNRMFHTRLCETAHNRYLHMAIEDLQDTIALLPQSIFSAKGRTQIAHDEHAAIIAAIRDRDTELAEERMSQHVRAVLDTRLSLAQSDKTPSFAAR